MLKIPADKQTSPGIEVWRLKQGLLSGDSGRHNRNLSVWLPLESAPASCPPATESCFTSTQSSGETLATLIPHPVRPWGQQSFSAGRESSCGEKKWKQKAQIIILDGAIYRAQQLLHAAADDIHNVQWFHFFFLLSCYSSYMLDLHFLCGFAWASLCCINHKKWKHQNMELGQRQSF